MSRISNLPNQQLHLDTAGTQSLRHQIIHVALNFSKLHLIHSFPCVPMQENFPAEHGSKLLAHPPEHFLELSGCCQVPATGGIGCTHHVFGIPHLLGEFRSASMNLQLGVVSLSVLKQMLYKASLSNTIHSSAFSTNWWTWTERVALQGSTTVSKTFGDGESKHHAIQIFFSDLGNEKCSHS
ncbi:hypothetical protein L1987_24110 [Smallanthus sonchifolius]|uniref:Uncharacterized protein n=1 Tax=Smallanthus sonchifolius TaxID=185202 RepID=A0ACB9IIT5_9ASTR|nr:hypothetical protein L1987_24110 [Smallanthus sonchifolius]